MERVTGGERCVTRLTDRPGRVAYYRRMRRVALFLSAATAMTGCLRLTGDCVSPLYYGIDLMVVDAKTRQMAAVMPSVSLLEGGSVVEHYPGGEGEYSRLMWPMALGRTGTYTVRVTAPGYVGWERTGVKVSADHCGMVKTVHLRADLIPRP